MLKTTPLALLIGFSLGTPQTANSQSSAPLEILKLAPYVYRLSWPSDVFSKYQLEVSPDLTTWMNLGSQISGDGTVKSMQITQSEPKNFYRFKENAIRFGFDQTFIPGSDDYGSAGVEIASVGFPIYFYGSSKSLLYVNLNGNITFDSAFLSWRPSTLGGIEVPIIAPFWADTDTSKGSAATPVKLCKQITFGPGSVSGRKAFGVNWVDVGYYTPAFGGYDKLNSFQLVLIEASPPALPGDFDVEFNYNRILWESGTVGGGINGFGGLSARVGFSDGIDRSLELAGSGQPSFFLDSNTSTGLIHGSRNSEKLGRYVFYVRNGNVLGGLKVSAGSDFTLPTSSTLSANLSGTAQDPDNPTAVLPVQWSVLTSEGTGNVTFTSQNSINTAVNIPITIGTVIIQLKATSLVDPNITASDSIKIERY